MGASSTLTPGRSDRFKLPRPAVLWVVLTAIPVLAVVLFAVFQPVQVRPRMGLAPGYALTNQAGQPVTSEDLRGKFVFYNFTYADCQEPCPQTTPVMAEVQTLAKSLDLGGIPLELVTISINPEQDSPERLQAYAAANGIDTGNWQLLTGPADRIKNVVGGGFHVFYEQDEQGEIDFVPTFALVDGNGILRALYETATPSVATIERDLKLVVDEVKSADGPNSLVYEAAHLFLCYPPQ